MAARRLVALLLHLFPQLRPAARRRAWPAAALALALAACAVSTDPSGDEADVLAPSVTATATVAVQYDVGWGNRITLRCGGGGHSWSVSLPATWTAGNRWVVSLSWSSGTIECKPLHNDTTWAVGPNWKITPGATVTMWPFFFHQAGRLTRTPNWRSNVLGDSRAIWTYYPPSYDENAAQRYPVVYMHDGQNLFLDSYAFGGVSWAVAQAMDQGIVNGTIREALVIGIDNDVDRLSEYTPVADPSYGGGNAANYLQFITTELKPQMDQQLRTMPGADQTAIVGSSLGGLVSVWAGLTRPDVFKLVGALSPSTWWNGTWIIGQTTAATGPLPTRVYLDSGNAGTSGDDYINTTNLANAWKQKAGVTVRHLVQSGATHSETYWRQRIPGALQFLLGPRP